MPFVAKNKKKTRVDKPECKKCTKALQELENIDDEADQLDIGFVKIHDESLADEYNLGTLPALVYYRHQIPILYEGCIHHRVQRIYSFIFVGNFSFDSCPKNRFNLN